MKKSRIVRMENRLHEIKRPQINFIRHVGLNVIVLPLRYRSLLTSYCIYYVRPTHQTQSMSQMMPLMMPQMMPQMIPQMIKMVIPQGLQMNAQMTAQTNAQINAHTNDANNPQSWANDAIL